MPASEVALAPDDVCGNADGAKPSAMLFGGLVSGHNCPAVWARLVTAVTAVAEGYDLSSISGAIVLIKADITLSPRQVGLLVGSLYFCMAVAAPIGGMLADRVGRKVALGVTYVLLVTGAICMGLAPNFVGLLLGRVIVGFGLGSGIAVCTTYITEVSPKDMRGQYVCLEDLFIVVGMAIGYFASCIFAGVPHDWRWILGAGAVPAFVALALLPHVVESPRWNMLRGDRQRAVADLERLVGAEEARRMEREWGEEHMRTGGWREVLCPASRWRRQAFVAGVGVMTAQMVTGVTIVMIFMSAIFVEEFPQEQAFRLSFSVGCLRVVILCVTIFWLLDRIGRKPLMLGSLVVTSISFMGMAVCYEYEAASILKVLFVTAFGLGFSAGMGPVPYVYCGEVFPADVRSKSVGVAVFFARVFSGISTLVFPSLKEHAGLPVCWAVLAVFNIACFIFVGLCAPETKGATLEEMHHIFKKTPGSP